MTNYKNIQNHPLRGKLKEKFTNWGLHTPEVEKYLDYIDKHEAIPGCSDNLTFSDYEGLRAHLVFEFDSRWAYVPIEMFARYVVTLRKTAKT